MSEHPTVYLFVHVIWSVQGREALLSKPVRKVLFAHMQKEGNEKGLRILTVNGVEDHVHCLVQLMPSQNLLQVVKSIKSASANWLNENRLLNVPFSWEEGYSALSVSPSGMQQQREFLDRQEEYHKTKTLDKELEIFEKFKDSL